jgi:L-asparaginase
MATPRCTAGIVTHYGRLPVRAFADPIPARPVRILAAGGTIGMTGPTAVPDLDAAALVAAIPRLAAHRDLSAHTILNAPSAHLTLADQLRIAREARDAARSGTGVVVTHGTDTLEETAMLCDLLDDAEAPIVLTGAIRPASAPGADGPANLVDAVSVAASRETAGMGALVVFGGEIHHARCVRKTDTTSLTAFSSPQTGLLGRVTEGHPTIWSRMPRNPPLDPPDLDRRVLIVPTAAGDDGTLARAALESGPDGVVIGTLGAGHLAPALMRLWAEAAERIPVVAYCRPERGVVLTGTYGYEGSERDLRGTAIIPAGFLSPQAARMKLLACVAAGLTIDETRWAFRQDDG